MPRRCVSRWADRGRSSLPQPKTADRAAIAVDVLQRVEHQGKERLASHVDVLVCSGDRADDLALRFAIAGIDPLVVIAETEAALDAALERTPEGATLDVIATYTAMIDIREAVARRAGVGSYWEETP